METQFFGSFDSYAVKEGKGTKKAILLLDWCEKESQKGIKQ